MRTKLIEALIQYVVSDYNRKLNRKYIIKELFLEQLERWLKEYDSATISYWNYCCKGLFVPCWYDEYAEGIWHMSKEEVNKMISEVFEVYEEFFNNEHRIAWYEDEDAIHILLIGRDLKKQKFDCFISVYKKGK